MNQDRYKASTKYLYFVHLDHERPSKQHLSSKTWKIDDFLDLIGAKCRKAYTPGEQLAVDKMLIKYKGRLSIVQYMPMKPAK